MRSRPHPVEVSDEVRHRGFERGPQSSTRPRASGVLCVPCVLVVGCPEGLTLRVHDAAVAVGAIARMCGLVTLERALELYRPLAIALTEDLYAFDPARLSRVARESGAEICTMGDDFDERELAQLLAARIAANARLPCG